MIRLLTLGDVLELKLSDGRFGYAQIIGKEDSFGFLFGLFHQVYDYPQKAETVVKEKFSQKVFINATSVRKNWNRIGNILCDYTFTSFCGTPQSFWQLFRNGVTTEIDSEEKSFEEMIADGHIHHALWLTTNIDQYMLAKKELKWTWN